MLVIWLTPTKYGHMLIISSIIKFLLFYTTVNELERVVKILDAFVTVTHYGDWCLNSNEDFSFCEIMDQFTFQYNVWFPEKLNHCIRIRSNSIVGSFSLTGNLTRDRFFKMLGEDVRQVDIAPYYTLSRLNQKKSSTVTRSISTRFLQLSISTADRQIDKPFRVSFIYTINRSQLKIIHHLKAKVSKLLLTLNSCRYSTSASNDQFISIIWIMTESILPNTQWPASPTDWSPESVEKQACQKQLTYSTYL